VSKEEFLAATVTPEAFPFLEIRSFSQNCPFLLLPLACSDFSLSGQTPQQAEILTGDRS
jgi:hypothetical protein